MTYWMGLLGISLVFVAAERLWPRRKAQKMLRREILTDLLYVALNGHFIGLLLSELWRPLAHFYSDTLGFATLDLHYKVAQNWPWALQMAVAFFAIDLVQWSIHNLLHRIPWLWEIHKVHHSVEELDWLASMRFHWGELIVYRTLQYPVLAVLGFDAGVLFVLALVSTAIGHFNHSNIRFDIGPLKYFLNSPQLHEWHHVHPDAGPADRNFAINLALWDWLFGTAYLPRDLQSPRRLGFHGLETFPRSVLLQEFWPLTAITSPKTAPAADAESPRT